MSSEAAGAVFQRLAGQCVCFDATVAPSPAAQEAVLTAALPSVVVGTEAEIVLSWLVPLPVAALLAAAVSLALRWAH